MAKSGTRVRGGRMAVPGLLAGGLVAGGLAVAAPAAPAGAVPTELFMSEYIEGSSNNKAIEIFNGTGAAVDLAAAGYQLQYFFNGSTTSGLTIALTGTVTDGEVHVVAQASAGAAILAQADQTNGAGWFDGDDAVVLRRGGATGPVVDSIGQVGVDPGTEWGTGLTSTADNTLRRLPAVEAGDAMPNDTFDPAATWAGLANDTFDGLGAHSLGSTDSAPAVTSTSPVAGAVDVAPGTSITVTFSEPVTVTGTWFTIECDVSGVHPATVSGGPTTSPSSRTHRSPRARRRADRPGRRRQQQDTTDPPDAMAADVSVGFTTASGDPCAGPTTLMSAVQGSAATSPVVGTVVTVQGVVVGDYQGTGGLQGFHLQEEDADADADPATSEGLFVFDVPRAPGSSRRRRAGDGHGHRVHFHRGAAHRAGRRERRGRVRDRGFCDAGRADLPGRGGRRSRALRGHARANWPDPHRDRDVHARPLRRGLALRRRPAGHSDGGRGARTGRHRPQGRTTAAGSSSTTPTANRTGTRSSTRSPAA